VFVLPVVLFPFLTAEAVVGWWQERQEGREVNDACLLVCIVLRPSLQREDSDKGQGQTTEGRGGHRGEGKELLFLRGRVRESGVCYRVRARAMGLAVAMAVVGLSFSPESSTVKGTEHHFFIL
jgi:hypothetical protein